jgi:hypothetical protein
MGILAQAAAAPGPTPGAGAYDLLETEILTGSQASVTFSSLNSTYGADYQHLQVRLVGRFAAAYTNIEAAIQFNADTGSNYTRHRLEGNGSSVSSTAQASQTYSTLTGMPGSASTSDVFGASVIDILDPFETTKYTTIRSFGGMTSGNHISLKSGLWMNTAALTEIKLFEGFFATSWVSGSRFSLYGLKAA